jgi:hypothetical protein
MIMNLMEYEYTKRQMQKHEAYLQYQRQVYRIDEMEDKTVNELLLAADNYLRNLKREIAEYDDFLRNQV